MTDRNKRGEKQSTTARSPRLRLAILRLCAGAGCLLAATGGARADQILGVLNSRTGILMPTLAAKEPTGTNEAAAAEEAAPVTSAGTVEIDGAFTFGREIPSSRLTASAMIGTTDSAYTNSTTLAVPVTRSGRSGSVNLIMPYYWTVAAAGESVTLTFEVDTSGAGGTFYSYRQSVTFALPKRGAKTFNFNIGF